MILKLSDDTTVKLSDIFINILPLYFLFELQNSIGLLLSSKFFYFPFRPLTMQSTGYQAFEEYLRRKELELSLINSKIEKDCSGSYSSSPLQNFSKRIHEFDVSVNEESSFTKIFKANRKVIYIFLIVLMALISAILMI